MESGSETYLIVRQDEIAAVDRGNGVATLPYVGRWNSAAAGLTTGFTSFLPGTAIPLHSHNIEESVLVVEGIAIAVIGEERYELRAGDATWIPAGIPHHFIQQGEGVLRIYWVYGGRRVTRTISATGKTVEHLSSEDRAADPG